MTVKSKNKTSMPGPRRWYDDACGTAQALEVLGERWALLIVRELIFGPRRFSEIKAELGGVSAQTLTQRLEGLEKAGVLFRRQLPPPANVQVYELTEWGYECETVLSVIGRWGARSPDHNPTLPLSASSIMLSFKTMFVPDKAKGADIRAGFIIGRESFAARAREQGYAVARGPVEDCDFVIEARPETIALLAYAGRPLRKSEQAGDAVLTGDRRAAEKFLTLFELPPKAARPATARA